MKLSEVLDRYRVTFDGDWLDHRIIDDGRVEVRWRDGAKFRFDDQEITRTGEGMFVISHRGLPVEFKAWEAASI